MGIWRTIAGQEAGVEGAHQIPGSEVGEVAGVGAQRPGVRHCEDVGFVVREMRGQWQAGEQSCAVSRRVH